MSSRTWRIAQLVFGGILVIAILVWWLTNPRISDEQQILNLVAKAEHGVETKNGREVMECVSPDYKDSSGYDRLQLLKMVNSWVRSPDQAEVTVEKQQIRVNGLTAVGKFSVQVYLESEGRKLRPVSAQIEVTFEKRWRKLRQVWLVKSVEGAAMLSAPEEYL